LPAFKSILASPAFAALPHRRDIAALAETGQPLPGTVQRQSAVEGIVGEEMAAAITGQKPVPRALGDAERRVDEFLAELN
jgi:multiple sugar transport system substrate-binding protein